MSWVSWPIFAAAIWSIEVPPRMSGPSVFLGCTPVRNAEAARTWSPVPSPGSGNIGSLWSPLTTVTWSWNGARGARVCGRMKSRPSAAGVHSSMMTPLGT